MISMSPLLFLLLVALIFSAGVAILWVLSRRIGRAGNWPQRQASFAAAIRRWTTGSQMRSIEKRFRRFPWRDLIELGLIAAWAVCVGQAYLDPNSRYWPIGAEVGVTMQSHFPWMALPKCGLCALWNGWINGGSPTLADVYGAVAHPVAVAAVITFGLVNGAKFILLISLFLAGAAQWWLAKVMRLSWLPRLWVAAMAVVGGHLAGRLQLGLVIFVLSTASISLLLAPALRLVQTGRRRNAVVLGVLAGFALLAGQGYMQVALVFAWLPALLVFAIRPTVPRFPWKEFALAGLIAILIAAILWVPMAHFWPNVAKDSDPTLSTLQPLQYLPLNLVINDHAFYTTTALDKTTEVALYANYIGLVPVLLTLAAVLLAPRSQRRLLWFFLIAIAFVFLLASGWPIIVARDVFHISLTGVRFPTLIAAAVVPLVLGLAAWGLDLLLKIDWSIFRKKRMSDRWSTLNVKLMWLILPVVAALAIASAYDFSKVWLTTIYVPLPSDVLATWRTPTAEWIYPPYTDGMWLPLGLNENFKMVTVARPWQWKDRQLPDYAIETIRNSAQVPAGPVLGRFDDLTVVAHPRVEYAFVDTGDAQIPCRANAIGGDIDVECQTDGAGRLIVKENNWSGWYASRDGEPIALADDRWLSVAAPAGLHRYEFRYRPWDVWVGAVLSLAGLSLAAILWIRAAHQESPVTPRSEKV